MSMLPAIRMRRRSRANQRGAILILFAILLPVFLIMASFSVDVAWMQLARTELRTATDAASRAGAHTLSQSQSLAQARQGAVEAARRNTVAGDPMQLAPGDVQFGGSTQANPNAKFAFDSSSRLVNAVRVNAQRNSAAPGGGVDLLFGGVLGVAEFEPTQSATATILDRDIALVLDRSGSMFGRKLRDLKRAVRAFVQELDATLPEEQLGLATYSTFSSRVAGLTKSFNNISNRSDQLNASGLTAIGDGLRDGIAIVTGDGSRPFAVPTVVVMTDGQHNRGRAPLGFAQQAAQQNITVHSVTFGSGADQRRMRQVAQATPNGQHFHANSGRDLSEVFREIARTLPVLNTE